MINGLNTLIMLIMIGLVILLQVFLSKSKSKIPGLIIPILFVSIGMRGITSLNIIKSSAYTFYPN
jgi:hypothetical protein